MKKILLIFIVIDKYEQTLKKIYGTYTLETYTVDGIDSLNTYQTVLGSNFYFYYNEDGAYNNLRIDGYRTDGQWGGDIDCRWRLLNGYKTFNIHASYGLNGVGPFGKDKNLDWEIVSLKKDEFFLKTIYSGKEYYIELK